MRAIVMLVLILVAGCATAPGGGTTDVPLEPPRQPIVAVNVGDSVEAALLQEKLAVVPVRVEGGRLYLEDREGVRRNLEALGYEVATVNPYDAHQRVVRISMGGRAPERVEQLGLQVINREADHWVVRGSLGALRAAVDAGYRISLVRDPEPRPRQVRVTVGSTADVIKLGGLMDIYNVAEKRPVVVDGAAFDAQIDRIRSLGFTVEIVPEKRGEK